ncbi:MAG: M23 family metallopeptidase [Schleiferiaceae bacterium]|nr:M23 family metallopeptidase [Schleiferiaceae bacterium]
MPVLGAAKADYNKDSFWYYPWGTSVTHKGIDIFAKKGTRLNSATGGMVLSTMNSAKGGKSIVVLGPKWRIHYYAHLDSIHTTSFQWVNSKTQIGTVGNSGNAKGKQAHLHYSIVSLIPYVWRIDSDRQGWKKMFFLNPIEYLEK